MRFLLPQGTLLSWVSAEGSVFFVSHKSDCSIKVFPYLSFFDKFIDAQWEKMHKAFVVPHRLAVQCTFAESPFRRWASSPVVDPPVVMYRWPLLREAPLVWI